MSFNVGLNLVEVDGKATPSIQPAPTSVTGFIIKAQRGIPEKVRRITNWSQFIEHFGDYTVSANGAYAVRGFFDNGGQTALVTRVVNTDGDVATPATLTSDEDPWNLNHNDTLTFSIDGSSTTVTFIDGPAILTGGSGPFNLPEDSGIQFTINGVVSDEFIFLSTNFGGDLSNASVAEAAAVINREFTGIRAYDLDGKLTVRTDRGDTDSTLKVTGTAALVLGFPTSTVSGDGNVNNINNIRSVDMVSILDSELGSQGVKVSQLGNAFVITHGTPGSASILEVVLGGVEDEFGFTPTLGTDVDTSQTAVAASKVFDAGSTHVLTVTAGYRGEPDVGLWGEDVSIAIENNKDVPSKFDLSVNHNDTAVETWSGLTMIDGDENYIESVVNDEISGSKFVIVDVSAATNPDETLDGNNALEYIPLEKGSDGTFSSSDELNAYIKALDYYKLVDIQLLCCPETDEQGFVAEALTHCKNEGDRMFAGHTPKDSDAGSIKTYSSSHRGDKVYGALYFPHIQINDPIGKRKWIPPTGHILGVYARTERERGIHKAPAGNAAMLNGALDVKYHITDADHTDLVKSAGVNAVRFIPGKGIVADSSRTLSTSTLWLYVNVRLLFNYVKSSLISGLRWVVQEPNDEALWNKAKYNSITPFLMGLWRRGSFGPGAPADVFTVKIDAENNTPEDLQQGNLNIEVYFYPSRPAETIIITVGQQEGAGSASES